VISLSYHTNIAKKQMSKKKGTVIYLSEEDKKRLEYIADNWGISQSSAVQRLIREYKNHGD
jgi:predicted DNA-binding protein